HENSVGAQVTFRFGKELASEQMGRRSSPGMRGLRDNEVVAPVGEPQRIACIVDDDLDARISERIRPSAARQRSVGGDYRRLELHDVDLAHGSGDSLESDAAAKA